jgi:hypothetical protein
VHAIRTGFPERQSELEQLARADGHPLVVRETQATRPEMVTA